MTKAATSSELIAMIEQAWAETPCPPHGSVTISPDKYEDRAEFEQILRGRHWREVPYYNLFEWRGDLAALTPEGFRFFLPAWLLVALVDVEIRGSLLDLFEVAARNGDMGERLSCFSSAEREALRTFFEYMAASPDQKVAPDPDEWRMLARTVPT